MGTWHIETSQETSNIGFQTSLSTKHGTVKLDDQIYELFEKNHYIIGVFIDLLKALDTVNHMY